MALVPAAFSVSTPPLELAELVAVAPVLAAAAALAVPLRALNPVPNEEKGEKLVELMVMA
jgi:hypothetical protein